MFSSGMREAREGSVKFTGCTRRSLLGALNHIYTDWIDESDPLLSDENNIVDLLQTSHRVRR